jgi:hypothetical protein
MVLTRLIKLTHGERYSLVSTRWLTTLFVSGDVLSFLAQSAGMTFFIPFSNVIFDDC